MRIGRRELLCASLAGVAGCVRAPDAPPPRVDLAPSPSEDLMREHGLIERMLFVYDECARRLETSIDLRPDVLGTTVHLVRAFACDYHEKLEEELVFPRFEQSLTHVELVRTLREQHATARKLTAILEQLTATPPQKKDDKKRLAAYARAFTRMYRPHAAREETVLFPDLHALLTPDERDALGAEVERRARVLFGDDGFERKMAEVDELEMALDLHDLGKLTADVR